eukprot:COSAG02_NODE_18917_length_910_cov_1.452528_1_plen_186_part_10
MELVLEPGGSQRGTDGDSPSTLERAMQRQLILKAEQLELTFAESMLRSEGRTEQVVRNDLGQDGAHRVPPRDAARPRTKAKKVQAKKFGTRHIETRMGSPPRAAPAQDRTRSSSRGRSRSVGRSTLSSPARSLASPPRRAKSRSKLDKRASTPSREQKALEQIEMATKFGWADLDELDQRWQRSLR